MNSNNYLKKELYERIKSDEQIFDFIQEFALDGLWYRDLENPEEEWMNAKFWTTLGYNPEEMPHKADAWKNIINADDLNSAGENLEKHINSPEHPCDQIVRYTHKQGQTVWIRRRGIVIRDIEGKPLRLLGAHIDITQEKQKPDLNHLTNQAAKVGGWEVDLINNKVSWTSFTKEIHEVSPDFEPDLESGINFYREGEYRDKIRSVVNKSIQEGSEWDEELIIVTAKGNDRWIRAKGIAEIINGKTTRLYGTFQDIHEEKVKEIKLIQSEERFRQTFENAAIGMAIIGIKGEWIKVNESLCKIIGYAEDELLQLTFQDITYPDDLETDLGLLAELITGKRYSYQLEKRYFHKNGSIVWVVLSVSMVKNEEGKPSHFVSQINDVTNHKKAQQDFAESHARLLSLLDATEQVSIIGTTIEGLITTFNKGAQNLLGYTAEEMLFKQTPIIIHKKDEVEVRAKELSYIFGKEIKGFEVFVKYVKRGQFEGREWTYIRKDGSEFPVQLMVTAQKNGAGEINGYLGVAVDISKIKEAEKKLTALNKSMESVNKELAHKNDELEQFAYIAAHDLQEPLRTISSFLSLLEKKYNNLLDEKGKQYIHFTIEGALRMRNTITDILNYSKAGITNNTNLDLNKMVNDISTTFKNGEKNQHAKISWQPLPILYADKTAMNQLFSNLIDNGLKYQQPGNTPVINISVEDKTDQWQFKIADNGIGIEPEFYEKIFDVFKRLHSKAEYEGTGIGLAICRKIVNNYKGEIWIEPTTGGGATFCFTICKN